MVTSLCVKREQKSSTGIIAGHIRDKRTEGNNEWSKQLPNRFAALTMKLSSLHAADARYHRNSLSLRLQSSEVVNYLNTVEIANDTVITYTYADTGADYFPSLMVSNIIISNSNESNSLLKCN